MSDVEKLNIDSIIARLLEGKSNSNIKCFYVKWLNVYFVILVRNSKPGKNVQLAENEIRGLCLKSRELFLSQPILLELEAPLKICGKQFFFLILSF